MNHASRAKAGATHNDDVIIAVMGATGSGKSTFINLVAGTQFTVGPTLRSCTKGVEISPPFLLGGKRVTLIDTPGFDDTNLTDTEVLTLIALFLSQACENGSLLSGIIFLHRISDRRVGGVARRNFNLFRNLCGDENMAHVVIGTTMWGQVTPEVGEARELELASEDIFFKPALVRGAQLVRHDHNLESARAILQSLVDNQPTILRIQRELVVEGKNITETTAGRELNQELIKLSREHTEQLAQVQQEMREAMRRRDMETKRELEQVRNELMDKVERTEQERDHLQSRYAREKEEMSRQLTFMKSSLQDEAAARERSDNMLRAARRSQQQQLADYVATRDTLTSQIADLQQRQQESSSSRSSGIMDLLVPAVTLLSGLYGVAPFCG